MRFSVVTPSFRNSDWLRLCVASVADQGVTVEHIVQDAGSDDGTLGWLPVDPRVRAFVEPDAGMYDAINRGLQRATGDILSYLNCDEQYLPGALAAVGDYFSAHPRTKLLFADFVVVNEQGDYRFHRRVQIPRRNHLWVAHLPAYSCGLFFRRHLIHEHGHRFNPDLRAVGDGDWMLRLLAARVKMAVLHRFTSVFTVRADNLGDSETALREARALHARAPRWVRALKPLWIGQHRVRRLLDGGWWQRPFAFQLYTRASPQQRVERRVTQPQWRWQ